MGKLNRNTFSTSRLLDFCSEKELTAQTGHPPREWPLVVLKELVDNALDACEEADVAPVIVVTVDRRGITVSDNGPGVPPETVAGVLDYNKRVSSREAYVSPTRGAQGNALKCILAMPFVLASDRGRVDISARGILHEITFTVDEIRQIPVIEHKTQEARNGKNGTDILVHWPDSACSILSDAKARFLQIGEDYTILNPHLTLSVEWFGERRKVSATAHKWPKWLPTHPTSPHWYGTDQFDRLVSASIAYDLDQEQDRKVREFVEEFGGLTGTAKQKVVLEATGLARANLSALRNGSGLDRELTAKLLKAMKDVARPVKAKSLGIIGREHIRTRFAELGCEMESFEYRKQVGIEDALPFVLEIAFAWRGETANSDQRERRIITGVNWSPGIVNPFRELGATGQSLDSILEQQRSGRDEPIVYLLHWASPRVQYTDRGKSAVALERPEEIEEHNDEKKTEEDGE
jgi:DNA topoisomerase VI subunit B